MALAVNVRAIHMLSEDVVVLSASASVVTRADHERKSDGRSVLDLDEVEIGRRQVNVEVDSGVEWMRTP